jgi:hypothetical protein
MDDLANNPPEAELADAALEQAPADTEQPDTDQSDDSDLDTDGADPEFEEVDVEGEKLAVPKTAAEKLKAAMLRQADYTRKTQELAAQREQFQQTTAQEQARIEAEKASIQSVARVVAIDDRLQQYANVDWQALSQSDPVSAQQQFFQYQQLKDARGQLVQQIQQHEAQRALQEQQATARYMQQANEVLGREIKGWGTPEVTKALREVAKELGADEKEVENVRSPWVIKALWAQKQLKELQAKASKAPTPPPATPVKTVTGARANATVNPDKMSPDEFAKWRNAELRKRGRL